MRIVKIKRKGDSMAIIKKGNKAKPIAEEIIPTSPPEFNILGSYPNREDWLAARLKGIGGSEVSILMGNNPYSSKLDLFINKVSEESSSMEDSEVMWAGRHLEKTIIEMYKEKSGRKAFTGDSIYIHKEYPYMLATIDALTYRINPISGEIEWGILEIKNTKESSESWSEGIPPMYIDQVQHYINVLDLKWGCIAYLKGGFRFEYKDFERDDLYIKEMTARTKEFWEQHIIPRIPPSPERSKDILLIHPESIPGGSVEIDSKMFKKLKRFQEIKSALSNWEKEKDEIDFELKNMLGSHETLTYKGKIVASWRSSSPRKYFDEKAFMEENPDIHKKYVKTRGSYRVLKTDYKITTD